MIDSVARRWAVEAKNNGQTVDSSAGDGTYAAGVNKITELMPALMADITQLAPPEQKVCLYLTESIHVNLGSLHSISYSVLLSDVHFVGSEHQLTLCPF